MTSACRLPTQTARTPIPISGFTWLLIYKSMKDKEKAAAMVKFLHWAMD
jgi:ABC-type phosphate transport system substrate-binding protein